MTGGVGQVKFNGNTIDADKVNFDSDTSVLKLTGLNSLTSGGAWQSSWTLSWK
jgi:alpha-glucosidase